MFSEQADRCEMCDRLCHVFLEQADEHAMCDRYGMCFQNKQKGVTCVIV